MKLQEREFFDSCSPEIASAVNAGTRRKLIERLRRTGRNFTSGMRPPRPRPKADWIISATASDTHDSGGRYQYLPLFAELAFNLVGRRDEWGLLVPSGISTDHTTRHSSANWSNRKPYTDCMILRIATRFSPMSMVVSNSAFSFRRQRHAIRVGGFCVFPSYDGRTGGKSGILNCGRRYSAAKSEYGDLSIFRSRRDAEITKSIYRRVPC